MAEHWPIGNGTEPIGSDLEPAGERCGGTVYRAERSGRLGPRQIRGARFTARRFGRRGVDPDEVRRFLARVADEVGDLHTELSAARDEANRLRFALREWQAGFPYGNERPTRYDRNERSGILPRQPRRYGGA
ncbi:DivIVA domain-containing protein [Micromonospora zhanjiangensis]|uniref:DivIVA domain-containing protein n=1 Tax=Micromonospora zhanjiangensis TaxID=1522057 RepID=A0ABV8KVS9_9ACTN